MLELDDYLVPRPFAQWIADKVIVEDEEIRIDKKRIPLTAQGVPHVFGIPSGDINISMVDDAGKSEFLAFFGLSDVPTIKFFGSKIIQGEDLSDEQYIRCFMIVVLSTVLCPTSNTKPSTKYMGSLIDVKKIRDLNWCKFTHMWLMQAIRKYQKDKSKHDRLTLTLGGCIYQLTVCFLDFTDFGAIQIPPVMPRICIWKGSMVKNFSDMLIGENGMYRPSKIKDESETCYAQESFSWASTTKNSNLRCAIDRTVGKSLPEQVKDDIFNSFQFYMKDENVSTCMKAKNLLLKTLQLVTSANVDSEHTLKVESSENNHNSVEEQHWSGSTVKVNSDGDYVEDDGTALDRRVKRMKQISQQSPVSIESDRRNHKQDKSQGNRGEGDDAIGSTKSVDAYNQGNNGNEQIEDNKKGEGMEPEEVRENTSKDDTKVLQARQQVSKRDGVQRETKVTSEHDAVEANIKETRAPSTSSFEYLLEAKNSTVLRQIQGKEAGKRNAPSFAGFTNQKTCTDKHLSQDKNNTNVINQGNKGSCSKIDFDINVTLTAGDNDSNDYETVKEVADNIETNEDVSWATYLDKAREKYFFHEDDTPTIRLFENWDDCGNEITEPELWRPLHMNDEDYNRKIENAKKSIVHQNIELGQTSKYKQTQEIKCSEVSVHCAQQAKSVAQICFSPRPLTALTPDGGIIDLTSPNANIHHGWTKAHTCYSPRNRNTTFRTTSTTPPSSKIFFSKAALTGRILFPEGANSECNLDGTENSPITFLDHNAASPDVQILSHRSFKQSCSNAVNRSDYHYNTKLMLGSTSSSYGKENIPPKRIVQPSKYLCSPYENQDRGPIMEHEVKLYKNILVLSENDYYKSKIGIEMDRCVVSLEQLGNSFRPGGWVEEYVINAYCRKLFNDNHPRISQRHYFFHIAAWKTEDGRLTFKDKALNSFNGSGKARPLELSNELFFPTIHKRHWFVFLVDLKARMFIFLDSKYEENSMFHKSIKHMMIRNFIQTWCDSHLKNMGFSQYQTAYPVLPKQDDWQAV